MHISGGFFVLCAGRARPKVGRSTSPWRGTHTHTDRHTRERRRDDKRQVRKEEKAAGTRVCTPPPSIGPKDKQSHSFTLYSFINIMPLLLWLYYNPPPLSYSIYNIIQYPLYNLVLLLLYYKILSSLSSSEKIFK